MLSLSKSKFTRFKFADPNENVHILVLKRDQFLAPLRYLTAEYLPRKHPVLVTFKDRAYAERLLKSFAYEGTRDSRYACCLPLREAAWISFEKLGMDLVVLYDDDELFYAGRGGSCAAGPHTGPPVRWPAHRPTL